MSDPILTTTKYVAECVIDGEWGRSTLISDSKEQIEKYAKMCFSALGYRIIRIETQEFIEQ